MAFVLNPRLVLEPASPRENYGDVSWVVSSPRCPSPGVAAFIGFAAQAKPARFESAGASALHTLTFVFNPGDARDRSLIDIDVLITLPFVGQFYRSLCA